MTFCVSTRTAAATASHTARISNECRPTDFRKPHCYRIRRYSLAQQHVTFIFSGPSQTLSLRTDISTRRITEKQNPRRHRQYAFGSDTPCNGETKKHTHTRAIWKVSKKRRRSSWGNNLKNKRHVMHFVLIINFHSFFSDFLISFLQSAVFGPRIYYNIGGHYECLWRRGNEKMITFSTSVIII